MLAFYDFPAEHWVHLRTTDPGNRMNPDKVVHPNPVNGQLHLGSSRRP